MKTAKLQLQQIQKISGTRFEKCASFYLKYNQMTERRGDRMIEIKIIQLQADCGGRQVDYNLSVEVEVVPTNHRSSD